MNTSEWLTPQASETALDQMAIMVQAYGRDKSIWNKKETAMMTEQEIRLKCLEMAREERDPCERESEKVVELATTYSRFVLKEKELEEKELERKDFVDLLRSQYEVLYHPLTGLPAVLKARQS